jgi:hypothetical protein
LNVRLIGLVKVLAAGTVALSLTACAQTASPSFKAAPGQSVDDVARSLTRTRAIAVFLAAACRTEGIALHQPDINRALEGDLANLQAQGYALPALNAAFKRASKDTSLVRSAIAYLEERGARKKDTASVCAVGEREIAENTVVGQLLKRV